MAEPWRSQADHRRPRAGDTWTAARVSEQFFTVLGTPMLHGRAFLPQEYQRGARTRGDFQLRHVARLASAATRLSSDEPCVSTSATRTPSSA